MRILVIGSGGREHAITWSFSRSQACEKIFCAKGNAGISSLADCVDISPTDPSALADFAEAQRIDLTFVGPEDALAAGVAIGDCVNGAGAQPAMSRSTKRPSAITS